MMKTTFRGMSLAACLLLSAAAYSQKGIPPPEQTAASVFTNYAQHEDFQPSLVKRLKVPDGLEVFAAATGLGKPRMIAAGEKGMLYVTRRDAGDVLLLQDPDCDGSFSELRTIVANFKGVHGIALRDGWLYLCSDRKLARGRLNADGTVQPLDTLIGDLPNGGQHDNRTLAFGPDGKLYITIGSDCNDCRETDPEHATIVQVNADGTGRKVFAKNLRNTLGIDWHPQTKELWGMDHGTDWRGDTIPPEELNKIIEGGDYGWPLVYGKQQVDYTREDPIGTTKEAYAKTTQPAVMTFPAHSAPMNFRFLAKQIVPQEFRNDALVTWHGSWNRKEPQGFKVQRILFKDGAPSGVDDFLTGFYNAARNTRFGRPVGLEITDDGKIFISDDANGVIYCIKMKSAKKANAAASNYYTKK